MKLSDYPYIMGDGTCQYDAAKGVVKIPSYVEIPKNNPQALLEAVAKQPVAVGIAAFCSNLMQYKSGVLTKGCGGTLNHAVVIVGYGTDTASGMDYWLVKNTWGVKWGEQGYFRVLRSMISGDAGLLQITTLASYPNL
jgi:KDEL-tailed cysteine endopeptidase